EISRMFPDKILTGSRIPVAVLLSSNFILIFLLAGGYLSSTWLIVPAMAPFIFLAIHWISGKPGSGANVQFSLGSMIYLLAGFSMIHVLAFSIGTEAVYTPRWILFTFYFLWMNDTMAYVSGRLVGSNRIWPAVSPGKTWEGSIGGAGFTIGLALIFSRYFPELSSVEWAAFAGIIILFGTLGDFLESWIKRKAGVKDSGNLLPGHGGVLDRFDSFLLAIPFVTIYLNFVL
ncbi:MAG: phosphatidate cytidylyltransferase, partial [Bacteroidales bacterium]|nr:phosphatidate cytidylyltransferase [Bacteroidales bacterium]